MKREIELKENITADEIIKQRLLIIRGKRVVLGQELAELYGVQVKVLIQAMKRNQERFPEDFVFQLTKEEFENLKSQFVTSSWGGLRRALPYAFTEHGVAMLSSVLKSKIAIEMNIFIVRAFIKMRESLENYKDLAIKVGEMEVTQIQDHAMLKNVHNVVKHLIEAPDKPKGKIGFETNAEN